VIDRQGVRAAIKFQFRQLATFIHPEYRHRKDLPHIPRFLSTRLQRDDYNILIDAVRRWGMVTMCTPFDEESVDLIESLDIDVLKIASCSATDKPLLEKVSKTSLPIIASTGGTTIDEIDRMVQIFTSHKVSFALHHCVSIYPTPHTNLNLNQITHLKRRYSPVEIGWSTHEDPNDDITIRLAFAKGATFFERHVGLATEEFQLNAYSSNAAQIEKWIEGYKIAVESCGGTHRAPAEPEETAALKSLMRGVYVNKNISCGEVIRPDEVFFAMPLLPGMLSSSKWKNNLVADKDYSTNQPLNSAIERNAETAEDTINSVMLQVRGMLRDARIHLGRTSQIELSHHYGLNLFRQYGAVIIDVINREYCKKLIIQLPRQKHPYHYHKKKEETFQILFGDLEITKNGNRTLLSPGDTFLIEPGNWHKFSSLDGVVFEEISTTHYDDDSYYHDERIVRISRSERKTIVPNWEL